MELLFTCSGTQKIKIIALTSIGVLHLLTDLPHTIDSITAEVRVAFNVRS
jgi:hypothetical protein